MHLLPRRVLRGRRGCQLLPPPVELLDRGKALGHQCGGPVELLRGKRHLGELLRQVRFRLVERPPRLIDQRFILL
jgi:hypothetical protein